MTWEQFCTTYKPGRYGRITSQPHIENDARLLQSILACALYRLDEHRRAT